MFDIGVGEAFVFVGLLVGVGFVGRALIRTVRVHARGANPDPTLISRTYVPL